MSNEKQLTPLQELISRMQVAYERGDKKYKPAFEYWLNEAKNLLPKERESHENFFVAGSERGTGEIPFNAEQYFDQIFKTEL